MKRVAFVTTNDYPGFGGSEYLWSQALVRMHVQGFDTGAIVNQAVLSTPQIQTIKSLTGRVFGRGSPRILRKLRVEHVWPRLGQARSGAWLDRFAPDFVVISQGASFDGWWCARQCRKRRIPYALVVQAVRESYWPLDEHVEELIAMYRGAACAFFLSASNKSVVEKQLAMTIDNADTVQNPYNVARDANPAWPDSSVAKLACVARLEPPSKGQDVLFEVLRADKWRHRPLEVSLFGSGRQTEVLRRLARMWDLGNVVFGGFVDDIETIWAAHQALVLPSRSEGLPLAIVEAMFCSRFCIATDVAGNADMIEDNVNGFIAMGSHPELLDDALERAWIRRDEWQDIGRAAGSTIRDAVSKDPVGDFVDALKSML